MCLRTVTLVLFLPCWLAALEQEAPTRSDWLPVRLALETGADDAVAKAEALIKRFPAWPGSYMGLAAYELARGDAGDRRRYAEAVRYADLALERSDDDPQPVSIIIAALTRMGEPKKALTIFRRYQELDDNGTLHLLASQAALTDGNLSRAEALVDQAIALVGPKQAPATFFTQKGLVLLRNGDTREAESMLNKATRFDDAQGEAWFNLGLARLSLADQAQRRGDDDLTAELEERADTALDNAAAHFDQDAEVKLAAALAALRVDDLESADTDLSVAESIGPQRDDVTLAKATTLTRLAARDNDREAFLRAAELLDGLPAGSGLQAALANTTVATAIGSGRYAIALEALERFGADTLEPVNRGLVRWLAGLQQFESERPDTAVSLLQQAENDLAAAAEQHPDHGSLHRYLGHCRSSLADALLASDQGEPAATALEAAAEAYTAGIFAGDHASGRYLLSLQSQRSAAHGYAAAADAIARDALDFSAWRVAIGNYGAAGAWRHPIHLGVWGLLLLGLLIIGLHKPPKPRQRGGSRREGTHRPVGRRSPAAEKNRRLQEQSKVDDTFLPKSMGPSTAPLEKGRKKHRSPSQAEPTKADDTLMPQTMVPKGKKNAALDRGKRRT